MKDNISLVLSLMIASFLISALIASAIEPPELFWPSFLAISCVMFIGFVVVAAVISHVWRFFWGSRWE